MSIRALAVAVAIAAIGCSVGGEASSPATAELGSPTPPPSADEHTQRIARAQAACSAIMEEIPMVVVRSGKATLAAAYEVSGTELTRYFEQTFGENPYGNGSAWWNEPTKIADICLFDGDLETLTPGPPGNDRSAARVLVVISDGAAQFWASTKVASNIPTTDPATISKGYDPTI